MEKLVDEETITPDELEIDEKGQKYSKKGMPMWSDRYRLE